jgi:glycosyltransferase involved in cell wall biosynthesis
MAQEHMKILVLSFYYKPDLCAGSFRTTALVNELRYVMPAGSHIDVVTTLPNRYKTYSVEALREEEQNNLTVHRIILPAHNSGMVDQSKAFCIFFREVVRYTESRDYDLVFATSSRLMTGVLGAWVARSKKALLYLDIRDIFVDTIEDVLPRYLAMLAKPLFSMFERWAVKHAAKVNLVSSGFTDYFNSRYPGQHFSYFTNGIDYEFIAVSYRISCKVAKNRIPVTVLYAGNLGEGQGLHAIIPELAKRMQGRVYFRIIGDGGRKEALRTALVRAKVDNVELLPPMNREQLIKAYQDVDVLFLHLNDYDAFKKVLPSKLFEYAAMGKPIWAGVSGYAADFIRAEIDNSAVFHPCNAAEAEQVFASLVLHDSPRSRFINKYARGNIMKEMAKDIVAVAKQV